MWKGAAEALGMIVVAPTDRGADAGYRFTPRERALSLAALRWARRRFDVDEDRVFLAGVSRGGHLAWDLALRRADLFAAAAPMIGGPRMSNGQGENNLRYLENVRALPIRDLQGAGDDPLLLENLRLAFARLAGWKADALLLEQAGLGHEFDFKAVDWAAFLGGARRDPRRAEVVRACAATGEGRALWAEVLRTERGVEEAFPFRADPKAWAALSREEQRRRFQEEVERRTARLAVRREAPGRFSAESSRVESFRLLLEESAVEPGKPVELRWKGRTLARPFRPDRRVLVEEFLERFDRSFLPVAEALF
jgi:hypothetical protein